MRYSPVHQIRKDNVKQLKLAWTTRLGICQSCLERGWRVEVTPLMANGKLFVSTPNGNVVALDAESGHHVWSFDAKLDTRIDYVEGFVSRGLALWRTSESDLTAPCSQRVLVATIDARLIAIDAVTGAPCLDFGQSGTVDLAAGVALDGGVGRRGSFGVTSPPTVVGDVVIVGSAVNKTVRRDTESGMVRAFRVQTGTLLWQFDPLPRDSANAKSSESDSSAAVATGGANVWSGITADTGRGLLFLPTATAAPDHYGGARPGRNDFANSVVALDVTTGRVAWSFQLVHHDLWDYDVAAPPILANLQLDRDTVPAVIIGSKTGMIYVLHRESGVPLLPVEERPVPQTDVPGENTWPTQPFSVGLPVLHDSRLTADMMFGVTAEDRLYCEAQLRALRSDGTFTPPSVKGSVIWPGIWGGINWDGLAWDPEHQTLVASVQRLAVVVRLHDRREAALTVDDAPAAEVLPQRGTPYIAVRKPFVAPSGVPCTKPPWGLLTALDLRAKIIRWTRPLGTIPSLRRLPQSDQWGSIVFGSPLITRGRLVFIGATQDDKFRAIDSDTGQTLWEHELPAGGQAGPMTYAYKGRQYIVIVAGGRQGIGTPGHTVVAFALQGGRRQ